MEAWYVGEVAALRVNWLKSHFIGSKKILTFLGVFFGLKHILYQRAGGLMAGEGIWY